VRESKDLFALSSTVLCMLKGCTACAYKIIVAPPDEIDGEPLRPKCRANVRPEECLRRIKGTAQLQGPTGLYEASQNILVLGDGNFTFSLALVRQLGGEKVDFTCTSIQSENEMAAVYPGIEKTLDALKNIPGVEVMHCVDATNLKASFTPGSRMWDRIIFNFPCVPDLPGKDGQHDQMEENRKLVQGILGSATPFLAPKTGEIHIVHKTKPPFSWWKIPELAADVEGCNYLHSVVFDSSTFPGYTPRKVEENKSFPVFDAVTFCFGVSEKPEEPEAEGLIQIDEVHANPQHLVKLCEGRLMQVVSMLQLPHHR